MLLVSYEFLLFFAASAVCYYLLCGRFQWVVLLAASYLFYLSGGLKVTGFILVTTVSTWLLGLKLGRLKGETKAYIKAHGLGREERKAYRAKRKAVSWRFLLIGLFLNFGILAVLKYTNFMIGNVEAIFHILGSEGALGRTDWVLPLGISYYTFQSMGYLIDVYRDKYEPEKSLGQFALFVSFFPQLVEGPISRFDEMREQFRRVHRFDGQEVAFGLQRMLWGYFKKLVVADRLVHAVLTVSRDPGQFGGSFALAGMVCYTVQIYADFSGGIDIVLGAAQVFGIKLPENFNRPYFSKTVGEYWRRWHMSLMAWLREYIFYPASVCGPVTKFSKWGKKRFGDAVGRRIPVYAASLLVWLVTGIWHGASWGFVFWGLINCAVILAASELAPWQRKFHEKHPGLKDRRAFKGFQICRTMLLLSLIQTLEYYQAVPLTVKMIGSMVFNFSLSAFWDGSLLALGLDGWDWALAGLGSLLMLFVSLAQRKGSVRAQIREKSWAVRFLCWFGLFLAVLVFGAYGHGFDASQFIYNQF